MANGQKVLPLRAATLVQNKRASARAKELDDLSYLIEKL
jgi:hypothetical protein